MNKDMDNVSLYSSLEIFTYTQAFFSILVIGRNYPSDFTCYAHVHVAYDTIRTVWKS